MYPCECRSGEGQLSSQIKLELVVAAAHLSYAIEDEVGAIGNMALKPVPKYGSCLTGKANDDIVGPLAAVARCSLKDGGDFGVVETRNEGRHVDEVEPGEFP